jgi:archaellum component FlaC
MILNAFNSLISSNMLTLEEAKNKARDSVSVKFKDEILTKVPSPNSLKEQLTTQIVSTQDLSRVEEKFLVLKNRCDSLIAQVDSKIEQINGIKNKINGIDARFDKIQEVLDIANQFIPVLRVIITTAPIILGASTGLFANGLLITRISDGLKVAKSKIVELEAIVKVLGSIQSYIDSQTQPINNSCDQAIEVLTNIRNQIKTSCDFIDQTFLQQITKFSSGLIDSATATDGTVVKFERPEEILSNLENSNKQLFIQYLEDFEGNTGYQIVKK